MVERSPGDAVTNGGLFVSNELEGSTPQALVTTPCKAIPIGRLQENEEIFPDARNLVEFALEVDGDDLGEAASDSESNLEEKMEEKSSKTIESELKVCFWIYSGDPPISKFEAQKMVELADKYADIIAPPLQHDLLQARQYSNVRVDVNEEDERVQSPYNPNYLRLYKIGVERFLEAAESSDKLTAAPVPVLKDEVKWVKNRIQDYQEYGEGIDVLCFNLQRLKPTSDTNRDVLRKLVGYMRRMGYFDSTLKYAVNPCRSYKINDNQRSAEDLALVGMGFDFIGENHWYRPVERGTDWVRDCRVLDRESLTYNVVAYGRSELREAWPDDGRTGMEFEPIIETNRQSERIRQEKLFNAEQTELVLKNLRDSIEAKETEDFVNEYDGLKHVKRSMQLIAEEYRDPESQTGLGEFS